MIRTYVLPANDASRRGLDDLVELAEGIASAMSSASLAKTLGSTRRPTASLTKVGEFFWISKSVPGAQVNLRFVETKPESGACWTLERPDGRVLRLQHPYNRRDPLRRTMCEGTQPARTASDLARDLGGPGTFLGEQPPTQISDLAEAMLMALRDRVYEDEGDRPGWCSLAAASPWGAASLRIAAGTGTKVRISTPAALGLEHSVGRWIVAELVDNTWHLRPYEAAARSAGLDPVNAIRIARNMARLEVETMLQNG